MMHSPQAASADGRAPAEAGPGTVRLKRLVGASLVGTTSERHDFFVYRSAARLSVSFGARPLGGRLAVRAGTFPFLSLFDSRSMRLVSPPVVVPAFGGFALLVATWLIGFTGTSLACLVGLAIVLALRERPAPERETFVPATG